MERKGLLITVEGIDGIGKSTQAEKIAAALKADGADVVLTKEPGASKMGQQIRNILFKSPSTKELDYRAVNMLFIAEHLQTVHDVIRPAINAGKIVICDRYADSNLAYMEALNAHPACVRATRELFGIVPDITILFLGSPSVMCDRANARNDDKQQGKSWADPLSLGKTQLAYEKQLGTAVRTLKFDVGNGDQDGVFKALWPQLQERIAKVKESRQHEPKNRHSSRGAQSRAVHQPA